MEGSLLSSCCRAGDRDIETAEDYGYKKYRVIRESLS